MSFFKLTYFGLSFTPKMVKFCWKRWGEKPLLINKAAQIPNMILLHVYYNYKTIRGSITANGTLLPPPEMVPGKTLVTMRIEEIGLKDASQYIDPFITITVKGQRQLSLSMFPYIQRFLDRRKI